MNTGGICIIIGAILYGTALICSFLKEAFELKINWHISCYVLSIIFAILSIVCIGI